MIESENFRKEFDVLLRDYVGRPSPLYLSEALSQLHGCKIYLKREDLNHTGAHKINNAIGQILLAKHMGKQRIIAETGAGQHGVATATVCALMKMPCTIYMGQPTWHANVRTWRRCDCSAPRWWLLRAETRPSKTLSTKPCKTGVLIPKKLFICSALPWDHTPTPTS